MEKCPYCAQPLEAGSLSCRDWVVWTPKLRRVLMIPRRQDVKLPRCGTLEDVEPYAYLCRNCRKVIVNY